jgi:hypothetical protein
MYQAFFRDHQLLVFPLVALVLFVAMFLTAVVRTLTRHRKDGAYDSLARMPLADDTRLAPVPPHGETDV